MTRALVISIAVMSIVLVQLWNYTGHKQLVQGASIAVFILGIGWAIPRRRAPSRPKMVGVLSIAYVLLILIELLRGAHSSAVFGSTTSALTSGATYFLVLGFAMVFISSAEDERESDIRVHALLLAPAAYAFTNALLYLGGQRAPVAQGVAAGSPAELLGTLGIHVERAQFPLTTGVNTMGIIASAGLAVCAVLLLQRSAVVPRLMLWCGLLSCLFCELWTDDRAALVICLAVVAFVWTNNWQTRFLTRWLAVALPLLPVIFVAALSLVGAGSANSAVSRGGDDLVTGNGRILIWRASWHALLSHPSLGQIIGWGANGQIPSGVSIYYDYLFAGQAANTSAFTTHDLVIQTILDGGYLTLAVLTGAVWSVCAVLRSELKWAPRAGISAMVALLAVIVLCGITESVPSYNTEALIALLLVFGAAMSFESRGAQASEAGKRFAHLATPAGDAPLAYQDVNGRDRVAT